MEEMKKFLQQTLQRVDGLYYILIADKDGVPFIKMSSPNAPSRIEERLHSLLNFGMVADQASKLEVGRTLSITSVYSKYQVIQMYSLPLIITFIANIDANTGYIQSLESQLEPLLNDLKEIAHDRHDLK